MRVKKCGSGLLFAMILPFALLFSMGTGFLLHVSAEGFSERVPGATGWGTTTINVYQEDMSPVGQIEAKEPFQILGVYNEDLLQVEYNGLTGYAEKKNVLINLPDVEPNIIYNLTNATGSVFTSTTRAGMVNLKLDLFGTQLYYNGNASVYYDSGSYEKTAGSRAGKVWNEKIGKYEFVVPMLYTAAEKISAARQLAAADGWNFKIYDAYRPNVATQLMNASFNSLYDWSDHTLKLAGYDTSFYVAAVLSSHNVGCAIDVTMVKGKEEAAMPTKMHVLSGDAVLLSYSPSGRICSQLAGRGYNYYASNFADTMTEDAKSMCRYMISAGLTGIGSEWWHYQDQEGYNRNNRYHSVLAEWYPCQLYAPVNAEAASEAVTTRADAVYQLWAAAGFPAADGDIEFTDVTEYDYYYNAVRWAVSKGIFFGSSASTFSPDDAITRAGFLHMFYRIYGGSAAYTPDMAVFEDVRSNAWYYNAVQWAAQQGIADQSSGSFHPTSVLTQRQMHDFLTRANLAGIALSLNYI